MTTLCGACRQVTAHTVVYRVGLRVLCAVCPCGHVYLDDTERM